jgi:hypothetical protein
MIPNEASVCQVYRSVTSRAEASICNRLSAGTGSNQAELSYSGQSSWSLDPSKAEIFKTSNGSHYTVSASVPVSSVVFNTSWLDTYDSSACLSLETQLGADFTEREVILAPGSYVVQLYSGL